MAQLILAVRLCHKNGLRGPKFQKVSGEGPPHPPLWHVVRFYFAPPNFTEPWFHPLLGNFLKETLVRYLTEFGVIKLSM